MRPFLALAVLLGLAGGAVGMATRYLPRQSTLGPSFRERQFQRLQPLEQSVIPPIVINPYYRPTLKDYATLCFKRYLNLSEERPFLTKGVTAAVVGGVGDVLSQSIVASAARVRFQWDVIRTLTFMMIGLCFKGPAMHVWFRALGRFGHWMEERTGFSDMKQSLVVLAIDQTIGVAILYPLFYVMYEVFSSVLSFRAPSLLALKMKMANTLLSVVMAQYYVWPVAQFLSFRYCPAVLRVLYCDAVGVFWNCFLCASLAA